MRYRSAVPVLLSVLICVLVSSDAWAMLNPRTGRFMQRDPAGYVDGMSQYAAFHVMHGGVDPSGMYSISRTYDRANEASQVRKQPSTGKITGKLEVDTSQCPDASTTRSDCDGNVEVSVTAKYHDIPLSGDANAARSRLKRGVFGIYRFDGTGWDPFILVEENPVKDFQDPIPSEDDFAFVKFRLADIPCSGGSISVTGDNYGDSILKLGEQPEKTGMEEVIRDRMYHIHVDVEIGCCGVVKKGNIILAKGNGNDITEVGAPVIEP